MSTKGKITLGAMVGVVTGFLAGILLAPKSGKETRADIAAAAKKAAHALQAEADEVLKKAKALQASLSDKSKAELEKLKSQLSFTRTKLTDAVENVSSKKDDKELQAAIKNANEAVDHLKKFIRNVK